MRSIRIKSPATSANVGPGYDIFALTLNEPYDEIEITLNQTGDITINMEGDRQDIPENPRDNVAGLAVQELLTRKNIRQGMNIRII